MRYVTTNIPLPENLLKALKIDAARQGKRMAEVVRGRLIVSLSAKGAKRKKKKSLYGLWKGVDIPDSLIEEAKRSLFP